MQIQPNETTKALSEPSARNVFRQMILGIEYLHFNQVIHRDIKPDNILYFEDPNARPDPICKIVDFGVSESFAKPGESALSFPLLFSSLLTLFFLWCASLVIGCINQLDRLLSWPRKFVWEVSHHGWSFVSC
jgi:serine/threonine protein kinase